MNISEDPRSHRDNNRRSAFRFLIRNIFFKYSQRRTSTSAMGRVPARPQRPSTHGPILLSPQGKVLPGKLLHDDVGRFLARNRTEIEDNPGIGNRRKRERRERGNGDLRALHVHRSRSRRAVKYVLRTGSNFLEWPKRRREFPATYARIRVNHKSIDHHAQLELPSAYFRLIRHASRGNILDHCAG